MVGFYDIENWLKNQYFNQFANYSILKSQLSATLRNKFFVFFKDVTIKLFYLYSLNRNYS